LVIRWKVAFGEEFYYLHLQLLAKVFADSSASYSNTPTKLLRKNSFPVEEALKSNELVNLIFSGPVGVLLLVRSFYRFLDRLCLLAVLDP